jgi:flagellar basal body-associated protein FliL
MSDSDSNDTSSIDEKKNKGSSLESYASGAGSFLLSIIIMMLIVLFYFSSGGLILFLCKISQANILPNEPNCFPYTNNAPIIKPSPIQTNIFTTFTDPEMSMKMDIPYEINSKNKIIELFKQYKEKPSSSFLGNYFISISESILQFNYTLITMVMNFMNTSFPEPAIIGVGPIICAFLYSFGILINTLYFVYLWFSKMSWFFKTNTNVSGDGLPQWEDVTIISPINSLLGLGLIIIFTCLLIFGFPFVSTIPMIFYHNSLISSLFLKAAMNGKQITSLNIVKETLKYYKLPVITIISLFVVLLAFANLGVIPGILSVVVLILIYYGGLSDDMFQPIAEKNLSPIVSYNQAIKKCIDTSKTNKKHGLLYNLIFGQKGGNITNQLKKISKNL